METQVERPAPLTGGPARAAANDGGFNHVAAAASKATPRHELQLRSGAATLPDKLARCRAPRATLEALARVGAAYSRRGDYCAATLAQFLESKLRGGATFDASELRALGLGLEGFEYAIDLPEGTAQPRPLKARAVRVEYTRISKECFD